MQVVSMTRVAVAVAAAIVLSGCSGLLNSKNSVVPSDNMQVGNSLALPPDLSLPAPDSRPQSYQTAATEDSIYGDASSSAGLAQPGQMTRGQQAALRRNGDIYDQYGISKFRPDGTKKEDWELRAELKAALLKRKKQKNPNYGTVFNMGNIWSDE